MHCHPVILVETSEEGLDMESYSYIKGCTWVREFGYMVPNIPPFPGGVCTQYKLTLSVTSYKTNLANQLFQLTTEEHKVFKLDLK